MTKIDFMFQNLEGLRTGKIWSNENLFLGNSNLNELLSTYMINGMPQL
jgi:hypothetical protein